MKAQHYFFLGIGGIGNSALAKHFKKQGALVAGYDKVKTELTADLEKGAIKVLYAFTPDILPDFVTAESTLIVCTAAIKENNSWYCFFKDNGFEIQKRAVVLADLANNQKCIAVAGTHGKTTTLAILTHIFCTARLSFTAFVGGVLEGYNSNYLSTGMEYVLVEADEFDRSFLHLNPDYVAITTVDPDHLDIYTTAEAFTETFSRFAGQVKNPPVLGPEVNLNGLSVGEEVSSTYWMDSLILVKGGYKANFYLDSEESTSFFISVLGKHNLFNSLMAAALAHQIGIPKETIGKALSTFKGIQRRMQILEWKPGHSIIDDYAHHPTEIKAVYSTLQERYANAHKTVIFQPHLYSRTQDFFEDFAEVLSLFDSVYLLPIYPARELPIEGVTSQALLEKIDHQQKALLNKEEALQRIANLPPGVVALLGAGDIGLMASAFKKIAV